MTLTKRRPGYTLLELMVVLVILALASAIVIPALLRPKSDIRPLQALVDRARETAARRGETIYLRIETNGAWHMEGGGLPTVADSANGRIGPLASVPLTLLVSPSGSCAFDVRSAAAGRAFSLDPLTCTISVPLATTSS